MRKFLSTIAIIFMASFATLALLAPIQNSRVYAADCGNVPDYVAEAAGCNGGNENLVPIIVENILKSVIGMAWLTSFVFIVIGGIKFISSRGSAETVQEGKRTILYALIGLAVTSLAFLIVNFAKDIVDKSQTETEEEDSSLEEIGATTGGGYSVYDASEYEFGAGPGSDTEVSRISMIAQKKLKEGSTESLIARITPSWLAKKEKITWISDAPKIVSVDKNGKITAKQEGTATITATTSNNKKASTKITVTKLIKPDSVTLEPTSINKLVVGKYYNLVATVYPRDATNKHITWSTDNAIVATVNSRGQVTGKKPGTANITAKTENGKSTTIPVKVVDEDGEAIKITNSLLRELEYFYQTNRQEPISCRCGCTAGSVSCGPATYMAAVYVLTHQRIDYPSFASEACGRWMEHAGSSIQKMSTVFAQEYESKYHVRVKNMPYNWDSVVKELKKGHPVILFVHWAGAPSGFTFTYGAHYVLALSYRNRGGGQVYIWSPVSEKAAPGRNIGDCSEGECWYDKSTYMLNVNDNAWSVQKI